MLLVSGILGSCGTTPPKEVQLIDFSSLELQQRDLSHLVVNAFEKKQTPVLYFSATWCGPCQRFKRSLKTEQVSNVLENVTLIMIDVDKDYISENFSAAYGVNEIPTFISVDATGKTLKKVTSAEWPDDTPEQIALVMQGFIGSYKIPSE